MKKIQSKATTIITIKDVENDNLSEREEYYWNEFVQIPFFDSELGFNENKKLLDFSCVHYAYDNYTILTNNQIIATLLVMSGVISVDKQHFKNLADIPQQRIDTYKRIVT